MDLTRKIYHRALLNPMEGLETLWHSYDSYENSLNKLIAKKLVAEKSSGYMAARSATKELLDIVSGIDFDELPSDNKGSFDSWMKWIEWERRNPLNLANKPLLHSRIVYAFRRALMSMRADEGMWLSYSNYLRFDVNKPEDTEIVLKQARKCCPLSLPIVLAGVDLRESRGGGDLDLIRPLLDEFIAFSENKLNQLKSEIIERSRRPSDPTDDDELIFENALIERRLGEVEEYLRIRDGVNGAQVRLLEVARRLGGLSAGRAVFASARKSVHATSAVFSAAASLEFRIRKDASIASKIYELGLNRFPTDLAFSREYLKFLLAQNDDGNVRALFERIVASIEGFRSTHSREVIELNEDEDVIKGVWQDFYAFEREIGDYQSVKKVEERMRAAFPDELEFKPEAFFMSRLPIESHVTAASSSPSNDFTLPQIRQKLHETGPFRLSESLFNLLLKVNEIGSYDGPKIDPGRFISFVERVVLPSSEKEINAGSRGAAALGRSSRNTDSRSARESRSSGSRRRRDHGDNDDDERESHRQKQPRNSSVFEDRRRY